MYWRFALYRIIAAAFLISAFPLFFVFFLLVKLTSKGSFLFRQQRTGKNKKPFTIYKIRTMIDHAELMQKNYAHLNQADGPVFKIKNDPRFTPLGKLLAASGLDELPQLINIVKGEMSFVGPRPLPIVEAKKIPRQYHLRFAVLPGLTSSWVVNGSHTLSFKQWMEYDMTDVTKSSLGRDIQIATMTVVVLLRLNTLSVWKMVMKKLKRNRLNRLHAGNPKLRRKNNTQPKPDRLG